ncbi:Ig-like domain-containing protein [Streptomyces sp. ET3-23]|uniref:L,D-transpeptidase n=1 Tax=Streptomyces sp. ET3-23 TaxID=2885643 RepID=UPI001D0F8D84|nr:Ig-like domain-containing protein [Streptomyces sp. ET3-23]MCC2280962.1 Ig-like domain-containing protein [Streptomyces sp. ET3-23]
MNLSKYVVTAIALCGLLVVALILCEIQNERDPARSKGTINTSENTTRPTIEFAQKDCSTSTGVTAPSGRVKVFDGKLTRVRMIAHDGTAVPGTYAPDRRSWTPDRSLAPATAYTLTAEAKDDDTTTRTATTSFITIDPQESATFSCTPQDGAVVGVGMPISLTFDKPVLYRDAVRSRITIHSSSGQKATGHWFGDRRLDFRPPTFWRPHSRINVHIDLDGVSTAPGIKGIQTQSVHFTTGPAQISTVDTQTHKMTVTSNGIPLRTLPISAGSPEHPTYNGIMVISEKTPTLRMNGSTVGFPQSHSADGYDIPDVPHAMRLTNTGTYIHGNYWAARGVFGTANTSHGCIGLEDTQPGTDLHTPAAWFYERSLPGDLVIVIGSTGPTVRPDNGFNGWNMDWSTWNNTTGSAPTPARITAWWQRKNSVRIYHPSSVLRRNSHHDGY